MGYISTRDYPKLVGQMPSAVLFSTITFNEEG